VAWLGATFAPLIPHSQYGSDWITIQEEAHFALRSTVLDFSSWDKHELESLGHFHFFRKSKEISRLERRIGAKAFLDNPKRARRWTLMEALSTFSAQSPSS
jgi:hypothetical protein